MSLQLSQLVRSSVSGGGGIAILTFNRLSTFPAQSSLASHTIMNEETKHYKLMCESVVRKSIPRMVHYCLYFVAWLPQILDTLYIPFTTGCHKIMHDIIYFHLAIQIQAFHFGYFRFRMC